MVKLSQTLFFFYRNYVSSTKSFWFVPSWLLDSSDYGDKIVSLRVRRRGGVAARLGRLTCNLVVPGSSPPPCPSLDLLSVATSSTLQLRCVNSQLVCLLPVGIFKHFMFISDIEKRYWIVIETAQYK